ncbi:colostrum trypsin inhibitor-like isoform X3 [Xyrichtys novacula]|uniref:Colostrum trypsin inhibitor-like isoform X3 n=1 Tax=Xyrichtys novacula TaxID=13765 RepID=A0AAV1GBJ7_XYRNO|nr:colostrum trypsin inhibitor-like isoform X3 [Xyrichtys novacula]
MTKALVFISVLVLGWTWTLQGIYVRRPSDVDEEVSDNVAPAGNRTHVNGTEVCLLAPETGPCRAFVERFFYNSSSKNCETFVFGGCLGNRNNFENVTSCMERCHNTTHGQEEEELDSDELTELDQ